MTDVELNRTHPPSRTWGRKEESAGTSVLLLLLLVRDDGLLQQQGEMLLALGRSAAVWSPVDKLRWKLREKIDN